MRGQSAGGRTISGALACVDAAEGATAGVWPRPADTGGARITGRQIDEPPTITCDLARP